MTNTNTEHTLDARGLYCPEPVMMLHKLIDEVAEGSLIRILATDPSTVRDFTRFCQFLDHEMLSHQEQGGEYHFLIKK